MRSFFPLLYHSRYLLFKKQNPRWVWYNPQGRLHTEWCLWFSLVFSLTCRSCFMLFVSIKKITIRPIKKCKEKWKIWNSNGLEKSYKTYKSEIKKNQQNLKGYIKNSLCDRFLLAWAWTKYDWTNQIETRNQWKYFYNDKE